MPDGGGGEQLLAAAEEDLRLQPDDFGEAADPVPAGGQAGERLAPGDAVLFEEDVGPGAEGGGPRVVGRQGGGGTLNADELGPGVLALLVEPVGVDQPRP